LLQLEESRFFDQRPRQRQVFQVTDEGIAETSLEGAY